MKSKWLHAGLIILALLLSSACYLYGLLHTVPGEVYTGIRSMNASDYNPHISWIEQMRHGKFILNNLYTSEPHHGFMVRPVYFLLSIPFDSSSISNTWIFHFLRVFCGLILLLALPSVIRMFDKDHKVVMLMFLLLVFSSGAGWLLRKWIPHPADLGIPESLLFLSLGEAPHFAFSILLLWLGIGAIYLAPENPRQWIFVFLACLLVLWWEHPFDCVTLIALAAVNLWRIPGRNMRTLLLLGIAVLSFPPFIFYQAMKKAPAFAGWGTAQGLMLSPSFPSLLSAYLPLIMLAIPGAMLLARDAVKKKLLFFLFTWMVLQLILMYIPSSFQRRLISGIQFPFALLAAYGLSRLKSYSLIAVLLILLSAGNLYVTWTQIKEMRRDGMPYYLPVEYREAFDWLHRQNRQGAVLSGFTTGNFIPAYTGFPVYIGHSLGTPNSGLKKQEMLAFYKNPSSEFVERNKIQFVLFGLEERHLSGRDFPLLLFPRAYENRLVTIYDAMRSSNER